MEAKVPFTQLLLSAEAGEQWQNCIGKKEEEKDTSMLNPHLS